MNWGGNDTVVRIIDLKNDREVMAIRDFLSGFDLTFDPDSVEYTMALYREEKLIATGSLGGEVLRNIAVSRELQGEGLTAVVVSHLMSEAARRGRYHYFVFTKPDTAHLFSALGFQEIGRAEPYAALLESGVGSIGEYCRDLSRAVAALPPGPRAVLVVNCNPFTLGHRAVIAKAAAENSAVVVLVVSEDRSLFPFPVRLELVRDGLASLNNVLVLPGGKYIISAATFPDYFTRGAAVDAQTRLDADIFGRHIAPALGITRRYVGDEPYCEVTRCYNQAMLEVLPEHGVEVVVMPRLAQDGVPVSASRVRELLRTEDWDALRQLVPDTTYRYLRSDAAWPVLESIRISNSRH
ncbi:MAG TPA: [citrate (pro-3S)-lyase] ligase [Patescibacteria group bacterium]|nr:[citrate (pro-3S)-lyase] ligase [Patescibacteria group bacterium]